MPIKMTEPDYRITFMSDGNEGQGVLTGRFPRRARVVSTTRLAPVIHFYRIYFQLLTSIASIPAFAVRTPFTCLLDAVQPVWVLTFPVTIWRHPQTAKRYHAGPHCGNFYTVGSAITHILKSYDLSHLQKTAGQTGLSGAG